MVASIAANHLAEFEGSVFLFPDKDAVILCKTVPKKILDGLLLDCMSFFTDSTNPGTSLCSLFDLSINWQEFYNLVQNKSTAVTQKDQPAIASPATTQAKLPEQLHQAITKQIPERRAQRKDTLVMLVEDDPLSLRLAQRTLTSNKFAVVTAVDGGSARDAYTLNAPTIAFLDIGLPDISGHQVLAELKAADPDAYIVMLSAHSYQQDIMRSMQLGAKGFVCKPFTTAKLNYYIQQAQLHHTECATRLKNVQRPV